MANVIHRTTLQYLASVNEPDYPEPAWKWSPDMTAVAGVPPHRWTTPRRGNGGLTMPRQVKVDVRPVDDRWAEVEIDGRMETEPIADLFTEDYSDDDLIASLRMRRLIGSYGSVASREFIDAVNGAQGFLTPRGRRFVLGIEPDLSNPGFYIVTIGRRNGEPEQNVGVRESDLAWDYPDRRVVLRNLRTFLKADNHSSLTPAALAAVRAAKFWI